VPQELLLRVRETATTTTAPSAKVRNMSGTISRS
jgi:hypothetical protein